VQLGASNNRFSVEGAIVIAEALKANTTLKEIDLAWHNFGVEGIKAKFAVSFNIYSQFTHITHIHKHTKSPILGVFLLSGT
jgi:hypothetical protein